MSQPPQILPGVAEGRRGATGTGFIALNLFFRRMTPSKGNKHRCSVGPLRRGLEQACARRQAKLAGAKIADRKPSEPRLPEFVKMQRGPQAAGRIARVRRVE
jgi:hypothetical protein